MTATADLILERHRVRRRLAIWRVVAIVAIVVAVIAMLPGKFGLGVSHVARIKIEGIILEDAKRDKLIAGLAKNPNVKALIVQVDSPGGTIAASESLYLAIRKVAEEKPVVAVMSEYAASGGYITAIAADHVVARGNTLTGSIGVVMQAPNVSGLLDKLGVGMTRVKSGPLKAEPSPTSEMTPEVLRAQEELIGDTFDWFRGLVEERRGLSGAKLDAVTDGRAYTGRQALARGLIDVIGDETTARDWLADTHEVDADLPVQTHSWAESDSPFAFGAAQEGTRLLRQLNRLSTATPRLYAIIQ